MFWNLDSCVIKDFGVVGNGSVSLIVISSLEALLVNDTPSFEKAGITQRRSVARCSYALETLLMRATGCFKTSGNVFPAMHCRISEDRKPLILLLLLLIFILLLLLLLLIFLLLILLLLVAPPPSLSSSSPPPPSPSPSLDLSFHIFTSFITIHILF